MAVSGGKEAGPEWRWAGDLNDLVLVVSSRRGNRVDASLVSRHKELQREVSDLSEAEKQLDELISKSSVQLRLLTEDPQNKKYPIIFLQV